MKRIIIDLDKDWYITQNPENGKWIIIYQPFDAKRGPEFDTRDQASHFWDETRKAGKLDYIP